MPFPSRKSAIIAVMDRTLVALHIILKSMLSDCDRTMIRDVYAWNHKHRFAYTSFYTFAVLEEIHYS